MPLQPEVRLQLLSRLVSRAAGAATQRLERSGPGPGPGNSGGSGVRPESAGAAHDSTPPDSASDSPREQLRLYRYSTHCTDLANLLRKHVSRTDRSPCPFPLLHSSPSGFTCFTHSALQITPSHWNTSPHLACRRCWVTAASIGRAAACRTEGTKATAIGTHCFIQLSARLLLYVLLYGGMLP